MTQLGIGCGKLVSRFGGLFRASQWIPNFLLPPTPDRADHWCAIGSRLKDNSGPWRCKWPKRAKVWPDSAIPNRAKAAKSVTRARVAVLCLAFPAAPHPNSLLLLAAYQALMAVPDSPMNINAQVLKENRLGRGRSPRKADYLRADCARLLPDLVRCPSWHQGHPGDLEHHRHVPMALTAGMLRRSPRPAGRCDRQNFSQETGKYGHTDYDYLFTSRNPEVVETTFFS